MSELRLKLDGTIPLDGFAQAVRHFNDLLKRIGGDVAQHDAIQWSVARLETGSAIVSALGHSSDIEALERADKVYGAVGESLRRGEEPPFSKEIQDSAYKLTRVIGNQIVSITMSVADEDQVIAMPYTGLKLIVDAKNKPAWGTVRGEVVSIAKRPKYHITLYDSLFDKAVGCTLSEEYADKIRESWGKQVEITGMVYRNEENDRPLRIRNVVDFQLIERRLGEFRLALGALPTSSGNELPEIIIRQMRDAD